ncbi:MAG: hypothetical protein DWQ44_13965 [Bacteroidetes bacterium]|nr:MAG: hypothetical protein DWQ33_03325 [Bacteroidota bacterium]REK07229.1 MAG: hypothetical protein DWQ39_01720 [Bacteroidota bacterium]REK31784.1 MAG: hypothetical protein DWQ44_13965 [Bacteroidota bacterium]REK48036.1 MAG: hypothetical protein DWQ48_11175 [Bacteroidota bacterium]
MGRSIKSISTLIILFVLLSRNSRSQEVYVHVSNKDIYIFLDELANTGVIELNSAIKPYSRMMIASRLSDALNRIDQLNERQQDELRFYLKDYGKEMQPDKNFDRRRDLFYHKDTLFAFTLNPILGFSYFTNDSGGFYHRWNGAEAHAYVGRKFGFYASLRDNRENRRLSDPLYLNQFNASNYKVDTEGGGDFDEMRGGITYTWNWGSLGLVKDHFVWGDNYNGANIFSGHQPSFTFLKLHMNPVRWFDFNYVHGWLVSDVIDSSKSYINNQSVRIHYFPKYLAANMFTFTPLRKLQFSIGNSIVYSDQNVHPAYLIPVFFYKTIDHSLTSTGSNFLGQNSQFFANISSRNIRNLHLYSSLFVDEVAIGRMTDKDRHSNFYSLKVGAHASNLFIDNLFLTAEYTRTNPLAYRHYLITATFESSSFNLGHYLKDNAQEVFLAVGYKPISRLHLEASSTFAQKGWDYRYTGVSYDLTGNGLGLPFIDRVTWQASEYAFKARYQLLHDAWVFGSFTVSDHHGLFDETYTMPYFRGKLNTVNLGANIGF